MELNAPDNLADLHKNSLNLGLDLQGGIHLVLEVKTEGLDLEEAQDAVARAQEIIRNRIDQSALPNLLFSVRAIIESL